MVNRASNAHKLSVNITDLRRVFLKKLDFTDSLTTMNSEAKGNPIIVRPLVDCRDSGAVSARQGSQKINLATISLSDLGSVALD